MTTGKELFQPSKFSKKREHSEYHEAVRTSDWLRGQIYKSPKNIVYTTRPFPGLKFTKMPSESGDGDDGFFNKRMGLEPGVHDFLFWWATSQCGFIELKEKGKSQRSSQIGFDSAIAELGFKNRAVCYTTEEVRDKLIAFGVPGYIPVPIPPRKLTHAEQLAAQYEWSRPPEEKK